MRLIGLAVVLAVSLLAAPLAAGAQPIPKPARIALVCGARCEGGGSDKLRQGLRELRADQIIE